MKETTPAAQVREIAEVLFDGYEITGGAWWQGAEGVYIVNFPKEPHQEMLLPDLDSLRLCLDRCSEGQRAAFNTQVLLARDSGIGPAPSTILTAPLPALWSALHRAVVKA